MTEADRLTEMAAEIERLEHDNEGLDEIIVDQAKVIELLRTRVVELEADHPREMPGPEFVQHLQGLYDRVLAREAAHAMQRGTLAQQHTEHEPQVAVSRHNIPPNAPPHGE